MIPLRSQRLCLPPHDRPWPATRRDCPRSGSLLPLPSVRSQGRVQQSHVGGSQAAMMMVRGDTGRREGERLEGGEWTPLRTDIGKGACCDQTPADMIGSGRMCADTGAVSVMRTPSALSKLRVAGGRGTRFSRPQKGSWATPPSSFARLPSALEYIYLSSLLPDSPRPSAVIPPIPCPPPLSSAAMPDAAPPSPNRKPISSTSAAARSQKKAGAPKPKGAVRAKSGCYTCRIRRKVCRPSTRRQTRTSRARCSPISFFRVFSPLCHITPRHSEMRRAAQRARRVPDLRQASSPMPWFRC